MIYTSYFAMQKKINDMKFIPISICAKTPQWFNGLVYKKLAPTYDILMEYKRNGDKERYTERYNNEVLSKLDPFHVIKDLRELTYPYHTGKVNIVLMCYEKSSDFCHRHLVADWLNKSFGENKVTELKFDK